MSNFIEDLDERYRRERKKNRIKKEDKTFVCNIPLRVKLYGSINENYIIRKGKLTRFLYIKNGCRVHFTSAGAAGHLGQPLFFCHSKHLLFLFYRNRQPDARRKRLKSKSGRTDAFILTKVIPFLPCGQPPRKKNRRAYDKPFPLLRSENAADFRSR